MRYDDDYYADELNYREKEWDEPGPEFGWTVITDRRNGEIVDWIPPDCRLCGGDHDWHICPTVRGLKNKLKGKKCGN